MELVCSALGDQLELAAGAGARVSVAARYITLELFDRVDGSMPNDCSQLREYSGACVVLRRSAGGEIVHVQAIQSHVVLVDARSCYCAAVSGSGLHGKQCQRIVSLLHGQVVKLIHVER